MEREREALWIVGEKGLERSEARREGICLPVQKDHGLCVGRLLREAAVLAGGLLGRTLG